jgi:menaquinone-9 beta-reductase
MRSKYDCAIVGGGLAGLSLANNLAMNGKSVVIFEKNAYPFHKVCGEYISMESWDYLTSLGMRLNDMKLPIIDKLGISAADGYMLEHNLDLGGFGISRHLMDSTLAKLAAEKGVTVMEQCKVTAVEKRGAYFSIYTNQGDCEATLVFGSFGKYMPSFLSENRPSNQSNQNYIGVKYHIKTDFAPNRIELHNFQDGYCGISMVEDEKCCLCYLTTANNLKKYNSSISLMEESILHKNPFIKKYFTTSQMLIEQPVVISNITFKRRSTVYKGIITLGDAAGTITPLCGNGMSMALRASSILSNLVEEFFDNKLSHDALINQYTNQWNGNFKSRITAGYYLQGLFGKNKMTSLALRSLHHTPRLMNKLVSLTHGERF